MHHIVARETRPDAQALFHLISNLARALTVSLTACAWSRIHFKRHDLRFHVLSLARRWWEAHSLILGHPPSSSSPLFPSLPLSPNPLNLFRLVQPAWHSSKGAKTRLAAELGKPLPVRSAWSTPQATLLRLFCQALFGAIKINQSVMWHNLCESHLDSSRGHMVSIWWSNQSLSSRHFSKSTLKNKGSKRAFLCSDSIVEPVWVPQRSLFFF